MNKFKINISRHRLIIAGGLVSAAMLLVALALPVSPARAAGDSVVQPVQIAELYQLQAAFHRVGSVHSLTGDTQDVINQRIQDMLALWTDDGVLLLAVGGTRDGYYIGKGDLFSNCSPPSGNYNNQGTLCTFFKYVAGSFQPQNIQISLAPAYETHFDVFGNTASVYFQCHYFNVGVNPWTVAAHRDFGGTALLVNGNWLFSNAVAQAPPTPIP